MCNKTLTSHKQEQSFPSSAIGLSMFDFSSAKLTFAVILHLSWELFTVLQNFPSLFPLVYHSPFLLHLLAITTSSAPPCSHYFFIAASKYSLLHCYPPPYDFFSIALLSVLLLSPLLHYCPDNTTLLSCCHNFFSPQFLLSSNTPLFSHLSWGSTLYIPHSLYHNIPVAFRVLQRGLQIEIAAVWNVCYWKWDGACLVNCVLFAWN